ncbi:hypothetical protein TREMEDRAFT_62169 [Tremella mesenterica DSM 1558]|uniref:uncharacterized protein n=1 Tax=Tremella mesenterica (strain ATCC 24925 / CBS 8224 / DSM 1558 / NBRC 9311 / NRRL Y-6157 / RJB 2259-6 / UBC 559-6) TaxID=578456 RepID=UPI0003F48D33|nr:uncharacterized protein TREMEDRAFT_62169 [Tremella mesenterica DSM 1558]EIW69306.1 hypothetical protein TREMEDRAFT_62169 [Tremella mesenterica DSM 1558]
MDTEQLLHLDPALTFKQKTEVVPGEEPGVRVVSQISANWRLGTLYQIAPDITCKVNNSSTPATDEECRAAIEQKYPPSGKEIRNMVSTFQGSNCLSTLDMQQSDSFLGYSGVWQSKAIPNKVVLVYDKLVVSGDNTVHQVTAVSLTLRSIRRDQNFNPAGLPDEEFTFQTPYAVYSRDSGLVFAGSKERQRVLELAERFLKPNAPAESIDELALVADNRFSMVIGQAEYGPAVVISFYTKNLDSERKALKEYLTSVGTCTGEGIQSKWGDHEALEYMV